MRETKRKLLELLIELKRQGKTIVGYGAPGKGNTLLNYCGIRTDFLDFTVDRNPYKQGRFLPGTHIPIYAPENDSTRSKPDYILILPWNFKDEILDAAGARPRVGRAVHRPDPVARRRLTSRERLVRGQRDQRCLRASPVDQLPAQRRSSTGRDGGPSRNRSGPSTRARA